MQGKNSRLPQLAAEKREERNSLFLNFFKLDSLEGDSEGKGGEGMRLG